MTDSERAIHDIRIVASAIEWNQARNEAVRLKALRGSFECELESSPDRSPCWKRVKAFDEDDERPVKYPVETWCEKCQARQAAHLDYRCATKRRGIAIRRLRALLARRVV